ncbi:MAG: non-homologous end-joining DNA ligase [Actinomycetota bacterium]
MSPAFTVPTPRELPVERQGEHWYFDEGRRRVRLSNLDKVFWPTERYTKGDLLAYYYNAAPLMLPYVGGRPLTMKRMPNGIEGHAFYEKNAPSHTPDWMPRCRVPSSERDGGFIDYLMADDVAALLFVANLGCIEFHPLHSRCDSISEPSYLFFDLDPFEPATFDDVLAVAHHVRAALEALGLESYPKTSGATGMQIYVGISPGFTYQQTRDLVGTVGRAIRAADPDRVTMEWDKSKRADKVFIDHNMNREGANIAAVYSVRPEPAAPVSTPLRWEEVEAAVVRPADFTIATIHERLAEVGDLFDGLPTQRAGITAAMHAMGMDTGERRNPGPQTAPAHLGEYEAKRDFTVTPEPKPTESATTDDRFVIQKHAARRLHYDLRLERDGVLASWAVPRGLPTVPGERRLAVRTEDHPLEYLDFEAWIPSGEYGAGEMRIFDRGTYEALEWEPRKMTVRLHGERVRGEYHLVKTNQDWLIFLSKRSAADQPEPPPQMKPMLADPGHEPFDDEAWTFEPKFDGVRTLAYVSTEGTRLMSRTGRDQTATYPELANLATFVNSINAVLDGEIVALTKEGRPSFELLQQRLNLSSPTDIARIRQRIPVHLYVFDILWLDGRDLTGLALTERRERLREAVTETGPVSLTYSSDAAGTAFFQAVKQLGLEGMIAKRLDSTYQQGMRTKDWRKVKAMRTQDFVILGWTTGSSSSSSAFGSLLVGAFGDGRLRWMGHVGTGFTGRVREKLQRKLEELVIGKPAIDEPEVAALRDAHWVRPELVCEVEYLEITSSGKLRAPSFKALRPDIPPEDCILERPLSILTRDGEGEGPA